MDVYLILTSLATLASSRGNNTYTIIDYACGFIPFKNDENKVSEVGTSFLAVARWLLDEAESNLKEETQ